MSDHTFIWENRSSPVQVYWQLRWGPCLITLEARPQYCDRGNWKVLVDSNLPFDIDHQDGFPRYYMDFDRAQDEIQDWLIKRYGDHDDEYWLERIHS